MGSLKELLEEYDRLGSSGSAHDFMLRQRRLEDWAAKAREAIARMARPEAEPRPAAGEGTPAERRPSTVLP